MKKLIFTILLIFTIVFGFSVSTKAYTSYDSLDISGQPHLSFYYNGETEAYIVMSALYYNADIIITYETFIDFDNTRQQNASISTLINNNDLIVVQDKTILLTTWYGTSEILLIENDIVILQINNIDLFDYSEISSTNYFDFYYMITYKNEISKIGYGENGYIYYPSTAIINLFNSYYTVYTQAYNYGTSKLDTETEEAYKNGYEQGQAYSDSYYINLLTIKTNDFNEILKAKQQEYYNIGYDAGLSMGESNSLGFGSILSTFFGIFNVLGIKILNDITLGHILAVPLLLGLLSFIIGVATASFRKKG